LELDRAFERLDRRRRPERGLHDVEVDRREDVVPLAHEARVRPDAHPHVHVSGPAAELAGVPLAGDADLLTVVDSSRDLHLQLPLLECAPGALALSARRRDETSGAAALRTCVGPDELPEHAAGHLLNTARSAAAGTRDRRRSGLGTAAGAAAALNRD